MNWGQLVTRANKREAAARRFRWKRYLESLPQRDLIALRDCLKPGEARNEVEQYIDASKSKSGGSGRRAIPTAG